MGFLEEIKKKTIIADGAMGTLLYSNGIGNCFEELNLSDPEQVQSIHRNYLNAGAQVIQTNTYSANYEKLLRYGLEDQVKEINATAVRLARNAVADYQRAKKPSKELQQENKYIFGTIGGVRSIPGKPISPSEIKRNFREQLYCLLLEGVDGILLETYYDLEELSTVLAIARKETNLPIISQLSIQDVGMVQGGITVSEAFTRLEDLGADIVGLNCRMGPHHMIRSFEEVPLPERAFLSAYPNASLPSYDDGRFHYSSNAEYFKAAAAALWEQGVRLLGGCCGTTPEHIRAISSAVKNKAPVKQKKVSPAARKIEVEAATNPSHGGALLHEIPKKHQAVIVELDPPKNLDTNKFLEGAKALENAGVDAITMADNSMATPRISNISMAMLLKEKIAVPSVVHLTCRDRNLIGLQSHLMGLSTIGVENILAVTGDPAKVGDFPGASSVYDLSSMELIQMIKQCNDGQSFTGKSLGRKTNFTVGAAFNPNVRHLNKAVERLEKKIAAGADYFLSQPVYSIEQMEFIFDQTKHIKAPIYLGIMPLTSSRNAEFLHHEVPGITLTDDVRKTMERYKEDKLKSKEEGIAIAKHLIDGALNYFRGIYLVTPFMNYDMTCELTTYIREKTGTTSHINNAEKRKVSDGYHII